MSRSSSEMSVCWRSPVSSSSRSSSSSLRSRASSSSRSSTSAGSSIEIDAEVAAVVHLDGRVTRGTRRLLVGREQRVLERGDERALLDPLLALDLANGFDDLLAHGSTSRRSDCPARSTRTECPRSAPSTTSVTASVPASFNFALELRPAVDRLARAERDPAAEHAREMTPACAAAARFPGDETSTRVLAQVVAQHVGDAHAELVVDPGRMVDVDDEPVRVCELDGQHLDPRQVVLDPGCDLTLAAAVPSRVSWPCALPCP